MQDHVSAARGLVLCGDREVCFTAGMPSRGCVGGLARAARFDVRTGLDRLELRPISRSSATQRAGRAGRLGPGRCIRLWTRHDEAGRREHDVPEVLRVDLGRTLLELAAWNLRDPATLAWLDPPPPATLEPGPTTAHGSSVPDDHLAILQALERGEIDLAAARQRPDPLDGEEPIQA